MTHEAAERSWAEGEPVEFYRFVRGTNFWRYNTSDRILTRLEDEVEQPYAGTSISRGRIQRGSEGGRLTLSINVPRSLAVAELWMPYPTSQAVGLDIFRENIGKTGSSMVWSGRVVSPVYRPETVELKGEPTATYARKAGQAQAWQRGCMHVLYGQGHGLCNADREAFAVNATVSSVMANIVTSAGFDVFDKPTRLGGGYIKWTDVDGVEHRRSISSHNGSTINLLYGSNDLPNGTVVRAYPGCAHNIDDCTNFFSNRPNYGGEPDSPERSPFNGNPVF